MAERISIARAKTVFRTNFEGRDGNNREVAVEIADEERALELIEQGINVKQTKPMEQGRYIQLAEQNQWDTAYDEYVAEFQPRHYVSCTLAKHGQLPKEFVKIYMINEDSGKVIHVNNEDPQAIANLDNVYPEFVDVVASVYDWTYQGKSGRKLYISSIYLHYHTRNDDPFAYQVEKRNEEDIKLPFD